MSDLDRIIMLENRCKKIEDQLKEFGIRLSGKAEIELIFGD